MNRPTRALGAAAFGRALLLVWVGVSSAHADPLFVEESSGWSLNEAAVASEPWQTARDIDKLARWRLTDPVTAPFWAERRGHLLDGQRRELMALASLHRSDSLRSDVRLRLAEALLTAPRNPGVASALARLLDFEPPADLVDEAALVRARDAISRGSPADAAEALSTALGNALEPPSVWCDLATEATSTFALTSIRPYALALCDDREPSWEGTATNGPAVEATADALLRLGRRRYRRGDGEDARAALRSVADRNVAPQRFRCDAAALLARSERRTGDASLSRSRYEWVVRECGDFDDPMIRALLGMGRACVDEASRGCAEANLWQLAADYPAATQRDDALFYLSELYRNSSDELAEAEVLRAIFHLDRDGDMWREAVWRSARRQLDGGFVESAVRLLDRGIAAFEWDATYYSQGRFEYVLGRIHQRQGDAAGAEMRWAEAIDRYPLTFYAALSCDALSDLDADCRWPRRGDRAGSVPPPVLWPLGDCLARDGRWSDLLRAGRLAQAADAIGSLGSICPEARWIRALLLDLAGDPATAHDIPRREINGWQRRVGGDHDRRWSIAYPRPYLKLVQAEARRTGLEEALIFAVMREESAFQSGVHSYAGAQGLMQLMPRTARGHAEDVDGEITIERLAEPAVNIRIGANFLAHLDRHMDDNTLLMVASYNAGRGAVRRWLGRRPLEDPGLWIETVPSTQTRNYTKRVLSSLEVYRYLY